MTNRRQRKTWAQVLGEAGYPQEDFEEVAAEWVRLGMGPDDYEELGGDLGQALDFYEMKEDVMWGMDDE